MCISIECEVMEGVTGLRCVEGEMRLCVCVCVCVCVCREKLVVQGETGQMGMRDVSVCKENRRVFSWCIKRWVCECFGETG